VEFQVIFTDAQREHIKDGDQYAIVVSTGETGRPPDIEDNATIVADISVFHYDRDEEGLIYNQHINYFDSFGANDGDRAFTNRATWNGCFVGFEGSFRLAQFDDFSRSRILSMESRLVLVNDNDDQDVHVLWTKTMPISPAAPLNVFPVDGFSYQIISGSSNDTTKLPSGEALNFNQVRSLPPYPVDYQSVFVSGSIPRIPWRYWIENLNIPNVFFDPDEPNNNLNQKTSNYSGVNGYSVYHELYIMVEYTYLVDAAPGSASRKDAVVTVTPYHVRSDAFEILDFDDDGNPSVEFSGTVEVLDTLTNETDYFSSTEVRTIRITIEHDQGTLDVDDLWGEICIENKNATGEVWQLHSHKDFSNELNPLTGSQEVSPTNFNYVEIVSELNVVYLYCKTAPENISPGLDFNVYYILGKKTI